MVAVVAHHKIPVVVVASSNIGFYQPREHLPQKLVRPGAEGSLPSKAAWDKSKSPLLWTYDLTVVSGAPATLLAPFAGPRPPRRSDIFYDCFQQSTPPTNPQSTRTLLGNNNRRAMP